MLQSSKKKPVPKKKRNSSKKESSISQFPGESQSALYFKKIIIVSMVFVVIGLGIAVWSYLSLKGIV